MSVVPPVRTGTGGGTDGSREIFLRTLSGVEVVVKDWSDFFSFNHLRNFFTQSSMWCHFYFYRLHWSGLGSIGMHYLSSDTMMLVFCSRIDFMTRVSVVFFLIRRRNVNCLKRLCLKVFQRLCLVCAAVQREFFFNKKIKTGSCVAAYTYWIASV